MPERASPAWRKPRGRDLRRIRRDEAFHRAAAHVETLVGRDREDAPHAGRPLGPEDRKVDGGLRLARIEGPAQDEAHREGAEPAGAEVEEHAARVPFALDAGVHGAEAPLLVADLCPVEVVARGDRDGELEEPRLLHGHVEEGAEDRRAAAEIEDAALRDGDLGRHGLHGEPEPPLPAGVAVGEDRVPAGVARPLLGHPGRQVAGRHAVEARRLRGARRHGRDDLDREEAGVPARAGEVHPRERGRGLPRGAGPLELQPQLVVPRHVVVEVDADLPQPALHLGVLPGADLRPLHLEDPLRRGHAHAEGAHVAPQHGEDRVRPRLEGGLGEVVDDLGARLEERLGAGRLHGAGTPGEPDLLRGADVGLDEGRPASRVGARGGEVRVDGDLHPLPGDREGEARHGGSRRGEDDGAIPVLRLDRGDEGDLQHVGPAPAHDHPAALPGLVEEDRGLPVEIRRSEGRVAEADGHRRFPLRGGRDLEGRIEDREVPLDAALVARRRHAGDRGGRVGAVHGLAPEILELLPGDEDPLALLLEDLAQVLEGDVDAHRRGAGILPLRGGRGLRGGGGLRLVALGARGGAGPEGGQGGEGEERGEPARAGHGDLRVPPAGAGSLQRRTGGQGSLDATD